MAPPSSALNRAIALYQLDLGQGLLRGMERALGIEDDHEIAGASAILQLLSRGPLEGANIVNLGHTAPPDYGNTAHLAGNPRPVYRT